MDQEHRYQRGWGLPRKPRFNHASTLRRIGAYIIDIILLWILNILFFFIFLFLGFVSWEMFLETEPGVLFSGFFRASYLILLGFSSIIDLIYFTLLESEIGGGATIGKRALNIKVVDEYGKKIDLGPSFIRNILRLLWQVPCIGFIILIIDVVLIADSDQRIGDKLAYTYVVKESGTIRGYPNYEISRGHPQQQEWDQSYSSQQIPSSSDADEAEIDRFFSIEDRKLRTDSSRCPKCGNISLVKSEDGGESCVNCSYER